MNTFKLFKSANSFIIQHPIFVLYYLFLMTISGFISYILKNLLQHGVESKVSDFATKYSSQGLWQMIISDSLTNYLKNPSTFYGAIILTFLVAFLVLGAVFFIQSLLQNKRSSLMSESIQAFYALIKAPWALLLLILSESYEIIGALIALWALNPGALGIVSIVLFVTLPIPGLVYIVIAIRCVYFWQLLYDKNYSFVSVFQISWAYLKRSIFTLIKFSLLSTAVVVTLYGLAYGLEFYFGSLYAASLLSVCALAYSQLLHFIGFNMIYNHVRTEK